uniref:Uncharacterized protein n=1 Tax=Globodera rostochiensis TaxID=31243 RepID=A0A914GPE9_GLORO
MGDDYWHYMQDQWEEGFKRRIGLEGDASEIQRKVEDYVDELRKLHDDREREGFERKMQLAYRMLDPRDADAEVKMLRGLRFAPGNLLS